jgi:GNAT superfamily N-acetyltransferase
MSIRPNESLRWNGGAGRIRFACIADLEQLAAIHAASRDLFHGVDRVEVGKLPIVDNQAVWRSFQQGGLLVASFDDTSVAGFGLSEPIGGYLHIHQMSVRPALTGRGLGAELLHGLVEIARARGDRGLTLITYRHIRWNLPFYAQHGFAELAVEDSPAHLKGLLAAEEAVGVDVAHRAIMIRPRPG